MACLDRETAMSYLRGDLEPEEAELWSAHLANCEVCRQRLCEVSELVDDVRQDLMLGDAWPATDWHGLEQLIHQEAGRQTSKDRFGWLRPRVLAAVAASLVVAGVVFWGQGDSVSASAILGQATRAEHGFAQHPGTVLHRVVTLEERRGVARTLVSRRRVEAWRKVGTSASARRAFDDAGAIVGGEWIDANGLRTVRALGQESHRLEGTQASPSPTELLVSGEAWRVDLSASVFSTLLPSGDTARVLKMPGAISISYESDGSGPIAAAMLTLSAVDLHAIEQTIQIDRGEDRREYRFAEDRVAILDTAAIPASVFDVDGGAPEESVVSARAPRAVRTAPSARTGRLLGLEIEALRLLNEAGALLGEQVTVSRTADHVRVHAMVDSEQRKEELERAMKPLEKERSVEVQIQTFAVAAQQQSDANVVTVRQVEIPAGDMPIAPRLRRYFGASGDQTANAEIERHIRVFAGQVVEHSRLLVQHAWAMKRLYGRYSPQERAALGMEARATWRRMIAEHAAVVIEHAEALRSSLEPVLSPGQRTAPGQEPSDSSADDAGAVIEQVLDLANTQDSTLRTAFSASSTARTGTLFVESPHFFERLDNLMTLARRVQAGD